MTSESMIMQRIQLIRLIVWVSVVWGCKRKAFQDYPNHLGEGVGWCTTESSVTKPEMRLSSFNVRCLRDYLIDFIDDDKILSDSL